MCNGPPSTEELGALTVFRKFCLQWYRRKLWLEARKYLSETHGKNWTEKLGREQSNLSEDVEAIRLILWRAGSNDWFEYPYGSSLLFFRFPARYRTQAKRGVRVMFTCKGPTTRYPQPRLKPDKKEVMKKKIKKFIDRKYITPPSGRQLKSLIKYFAVPKGIVDGEVQDWRVVFHAGANKLNECVWAPSFMLPTINSLLRIVDWKTYMEDRDVGDMFHNFPLHPNTRGYAGMDLGPLGFADDECTHRWMCWARNLMGFRSSPYNSIRMALVVEEIVRGDRHDPNNALQWGYIMLNLPGSSEYKPHIAWISKRRKDGSLASDYVTFVDDLRLAAEGRKRIAELGHTISTREAYVGMQDALRKLRSAGGTRRPGAWAGAAVYIEDDGVVVLTSQDKWDRMKAICSHWLDLINKGHTALDFKQLRSDRGFMVYVTQAYPGMKPYLKGFHLTLEMWRGNRDSEGWKEPESLEDIKLRLLADSLCEEEDIRTDGPISGLTPVAPRFKSDLEAILHLADGEKPQLRYVRSKHTMTAYYGFGDASSGGFGATVQRPGGLYGRYGLWGKDDEAQSSNYRELRNLVDTVEEEANEGHLNESELWLFTDNSTAEGCFYRGGSSSKLLHELVLRLRKAELKYGFVLHVVHVAGTRMIAQGTDGLSRGILLEGVNKGEDMLLFIDLSRSAVERHTRVLNFVRSWLDPIVGESKHLKPEEWFQEGHGIIGGEKDANGMWIPCHAGNGKAYIWTPPPVIADVALEECAKAVHKRTDAYHVFLIPRLYSPLWMRLLYKLSDFVFKLRPGSQHWPSCMHEPLFIGISLPLLNRNPWSVRGTPLLVDLERQLRQVLASGKGDGGDLLRQLLRTSRKLDSVSESVARRMLRMPGPRGVPSDENSR